MKINLLGSSKIQSAKKYSRGLVSPMLFGKKVSVGNRKAQSKLLVNAWKKERKFKI